MIVSPKITETVSNYVSRVCYPFVPKEAFLNSTIKDTVFLIINNFAFFEEDT